MTRDSQDAGSRNLGFAFFTVPVVVRDLHLKQRHRQDVKLVVIITLKCAIMSPCLSLLTPRPISDYHMAEAHTACYVAKLQSSPILMRAIVCSKLGPISRRHHIAIRLPLSFFLKVFLLRLEVL